MTNQLRKVGSAQRRGIAIADRTLAAGQLTVLLQTGLRQRDDGREGQQVEEDAHLKQFSGVSNS